MVDACPGCGGPIRPDARVCRHCLVVLDRDEWVQHDAGRLGADDRGGGRQLEGPPAGPLPVTGGGLLGLGTSAGVFGGAFRALGATLLARPRSRR